MTSPEDFKRDFPTGVEDGGSSGSSGWGGGFSVTFVITKKF
jgi:hypothetical protein